MAGAVSMAREIGAARELADWRKREVHPGPKVEDRAGRACGRSRAALRTRSIAPSAHVAGTGSEAVVDLAERRARASRHRRRGDAVAAADDEQRSDDRSR
jgi:hypothetical protein